MTKEEFMLQENERLKALGAKLQQYARLAGAMKAANTRRK